MHLDRLIARTLLLTLLSLSAGTRAAEPAQPDHGDVSLSTVIIYTPDPRALAGFYQRTLDLGQPSTALDQHIGYWLGTNYLGFEPVERISRNPGGPTVWFGVADLETTLARLLAAGATAQTPPQRQDWGDLHATVLDPDGNVLGLIQRGDSE